MTPPELPVLGQDPRFGGGLRSLTEAFWNAAEALGQRPHLHYVSRAIGLSPRFGPGLRPRPETQGIFAGTAYPSILPELDVVNQRLNAPRIAARVHAAPYLWVVAASAQYGAAALRAGRPYGCWLATGLEIEWASRRTSLSLPRRAALALNRPGLLSIERHVLQGAELVFGISAASSRSLEDAGGLAHGSVGVLPIPVDLDRLTPAPEDRWRAGLERPTVVFLGRGGDPRKNVGLLVDAFRLLRERIPSVRLLLVGERPALALPEGAEATGPVSDVAAELARGSVFVLPSRQEGFGIVVAEAFAAGLPAVVTPSGGPEELVRESGGGVVLEGFTAEELAATLEQLLGDAGRLAAMRRAARSYVEVHHSRARLEQLLVGAFERLERRKGAR